MSGAENVAGIPARDYKCVRPPLILEQRPTCATTRYTHTIVVVYLFHRKSGQILRSLLTDRDNTQAALRGVHARSSPRPRSDPPSLRYPRAIIAQPTVTRTDSSARHALLIRASDPDQPAAARSRRLWSGLAARRGGRRAGQGAWNIFSGPSNPGDRLAYIRVIDLLKPGISSSPETPRSRLAGGFEGSSFWTTFNRG